MTANLHIDTAGTKINREVALGALRQLIDITDQLADDSISMLNTGRHFWSTAAKIVMGLDIRKNLLAIRSLACNNLDDQIFIIYRAMFENVISLEYLSKMTLRGKRPLSPTKKAFLFITFPIYSRGLIEPSFQLSRDFRRIKLRRRRLVNDDRYWHGSNLMAICQELDKSRRDGKTPHVEAYRELYGTLSFVSHPNSKENIHYFQEISTGKLQLRPFFHLDTTIFFATLWASKAVRRWGVAVKTGKQVQIDLLTHKWKQYLK